MRVEVPGKVVLMGEYAVLDGAPALVVAIDRGVRCTVTDQPQLRIETPYDDRFVAPALRAVHARAAHYRFEDWNPVHTSTKAGFGGSAAATVAAVIAGRGAMSDLYEVQRIATDVHRRVQGGGSGIDIAASTHGGVIRFQDGVVHHQPDVNPVVIWSGQSAKTGPRVTQYLAWRQRESFARQTAEAVDHFGTDPVAAMRQMTVLLDAMSTSAKLDYWTPALREITRLALNFGGAAKPSGAGGGDIGVAIFSDEDARQSFETAIGKAGLMLIATQLVSGPTLNEAP